jgi:hypothetical protein
MSYLLDSNTFIEAKNGYYDFDVCPGFWDWVLARHAAGDVFSIDKIGKELTDGTDDLAAWVVNSASGLFLAPDAATIEQMKHVAEWVMKQPYDEKSRARFFAKADPFLIAHAAAHGHTVITHETKVGSDSKKVKVPNVCEAFGVSWMHSFALLRKEKARFVLAS